MTGKISGKTDNYDVNTCYIRNKAPNGPKEDKYGQMSTFNMGKNSGVDREIIKGLGEG